MEVPKKIWVDDNWETYNVEPSYIKTGKYIRADLVDGLVEALERLARLGNGNNYGNSLGNEIARAALKALEESE
jgi:hypothetical protein